MKSLLILVLLLGSAASFASERSQDRRLLDLLRELDQRNHPAQATSSVSPNGFDEEKCVAERFLPVDGVPLYWAQSLIRPSDFTLYLTPDEINRPVVYASFDSDMVDYSLPELQGMHLLHKGEIAVKGDPKAHSTQTAGLIASRSPVSIAPAAGVQHMFFSIPLNDDLGAWQQALQDVLEYNASVPEEKKIRVINISMGAKSGIATTEIRALLEEFDRRRETTIVMAAGNAYGFPVGDPFLNGIPSRADGTRYDSVVPVTALGLSRERLAFYSYYGEGTMMTAPSDIFLQSLDKDDKFSGTSGAAPEVAGALLTIQKVNPRLNAAQARAILKATALDAGPKGYDIQFGYGIPNAPLAAAVARQVGPSLSPTAPEAELVKAVEAAMAGQSFHGPASGVAGQSPSYARMKASATCDEYARRFDELVNQFLLGDGADSSELCSFYKSQKLSWGILNYCPDSDLVALGGTYPPEIQGPNYPMPSPDHPDQEPKATVNYPDGIFMENSIKQAWRLLDAWNAGTPPTPQQWEQLATAVPMAAAQVLAMNPQGSKFADLPNFVNILLQHGGQYLITNFLGSEAAVGMPGWDKLVSAYSLMGIYQAPGSPTIEISKLVAHFVLASPAATRHPAWAKLVGDMINNRVRGLYTVSDKNGVVLGKPRELSQLIAASAIMETLAAAPTLERPEWFGFVRSALQRFYGPTIASPMCSPLARKRADWATLIQGTLGSIKNNDGVPLNRALTVEAMANYPEFALSNCGEDVEKLFPGVREDAGKLFQKLQEQRKRELERLKQSQGQSQQMPQKP